jgi:uncharacterized protein
VIVVSDTSPISNLIVVGILLAVKQQKLISTVGPIMDALIHQANFWIKPNLYAEVLKLAGEQP